MDKFEVTVWYDVIDEERLHDDVSFDTWQEAYDYANSINCSNGYACTIWKNGCRNMDIG